MKNPRTGLFQVDPEPKGLNSLNRFFVLLIFVTVGFLIVGAFKPAVGDHEALRHEVAQLERRIEAERARLDKQKAEIELIKNDREYIEMIAREKLDLMKPNETIYRVKDRPR